ncbi:MAG: branched-chain amino acid ABC transporter permease [Sporichthyaceae bacterium]
MPRRIATLLASLVLALLAIPLLAGAASAAEDLHGRLRNDNTPVGGVRITVSTETGSPVGEAITDPAGEWAIVLPGAGTYQVSIDVATLPEGIGLRAGAEATVTREVGFGQLRPQLFPLGERAEVQASETNRTAQLIAEGLRFGLILALAAVGLSLIYGTTGLVNFAHGELVTFGAMSAYLLNVTLDVPLLPAAALTVIICGVAGSLQDRCFWGVLRRRGTGLLAMMIVSIGVALLVRYLYLYFFGAGNESYADYQSQPAVKAGPLPIALAPKDYWSMGIAVVALVLVLLALTRTRLGKATRAVADNPALASASGIDTDRVIRLVWTVGAALAGLAGILLGMAQQVNFQMGFNVLLLLFAAVTLGGLGSATGALLGALVIGVFIQLSTLVISPELKNVGALGVLILILMVRPQGILGRAERIG